MANQIVITEKTSQAKDIRAAVGFHYGDVLPVEGHLFDLLEPEDAVPAWKRWPPILPLSHRHRQRLPSNQGPQRIGPEPSRPEPTSSTRCYAGEKETGAIEGPGWKGIVLLAKPYIRRCRPAVYWTDEALRGATVFRRVAPRPAMP